MPSRSVRSATALALAASATTFAYVGSAAPAQAAGYNGYCKTSSGVTVVVDFRGLGGGVAIRCAPVGSGATGRDALKAAGIPMTGTGTYGESVVCTLYGKPDTVCPRMPPADAYWSYWHAPNGGSWTYSSEGLMSRTVIPGGFEGWSFSQGKNVAPGAAPSRPAAPKPPTSKPTHSTTSKPAPSRHTSTKAPTHDPAPGTSDGGASNGSNGAAGADQPKSTASGEAGKAGKSKVKGEAAKSKAAKSSAASSKAAKSKAAERKSKSAKAEASTKSKAAHSSSSTSSTAATGTSSGVPTNAAGSPLANSDDLIKDSKKKDSSGINATTVVGGGVLAALAIGGGIVAVIRRRGLGQ